MSLAPLSVELAPRFARSEVRPALAPARRLRWVRLLSFAGLGLYGVIRWASLLHPAPLGRLLGLVALALALIVVVPRLRRVGMPPALAAAGLLCLLALPVAGLNWQDFLHQRVAVSARTIGDGLSGLPGSFVPYAGSSPGIRLVIVLGAAVLLLDAAIVLAFAPRVLGDLRRAGAATALIALAVVPSTLLRPQLPYLQGLVLFILLVAFVWGERAYREGRGGALVLLAVAGLAGAVLAPRIDAHRPWLDYRSWTGNLVHPRVDQFTWNQRYGPLHWPRTGHVVFTVQAAHGDYWKAEDLDVFNGYGWVAGPVSAPALPAPSPALRTRWAQTIRVSVSGLRSSAVIASGSAAAPSALRGGVLPGDGAGTWVSIVPLSPGSSYSVNTYSPHPSPLELARAGTRYPRAALLPYLSLTVVPFGAPLTGATGQVQFPLFRAPGVRIDARAGAEARVVARTVAGSAYGSVYALARRLAATARTPYAYTMAVAHYLSVGYAYNEDPPARPDPLVSFLFRDKVGYCQQFSGAMALLLRMGGIPARVAAGFTSGSEQGPDRWAVTDIDAHAWVEAWFPRYGWVRFDPTPGVAPAREGSASIQFVKNLSGVGDGSGGGSRREPAAAPGHAGTRRPGTASGTIPWLLVPGLALAALIGLLAISALAPEPTAEQRLEELERALARTGRPVEAEVTLAALEQRFHDFPEAAGYIRALRLCRYAGSSAPAGRAGRRALREQLRHGLGVSGRLRALWALPPGRFSWPRRSREG